MEVVNHHALRRDNTLLAITHLSQFLDYVTGFGGLLVPLIIWFASKDKIQGMDQHGRSIINFQLSLLLYIVISIPAILLLGLGLLGFLSVALIGFIVPIVNAVKAVNGEPPSYFMTIRFI
ncbi:DUF4870 domain-containing protein [Croceitalea dokdonensis]|uniref:DUF4870 domain-containing protein n=1 Tax=Croceitalea dokdonensis TaxID=346188 RepID=UPI0006CA46B1|nr:DUF4870 domain-containing protein [Croceitalea dokdonensis]